MLIYLIFIFSIYFGFLQVCIAGWLKFVQQYELEYSARNEFASVIVAVRNEELSIDPLLESLRLQDYPYNNFEVIFVDDHSTDQSEQKIQDWIKDNPDIQSSLLLSKGKGKKQALSHGIQCSRGSIILTSDADCFLPMTWISRMVMSFAVDTTMVIGLVKIQQGESLFSKLQALEFSSLIGAGVSLLELDFPVLCNGASLGFRKASFNAVDGYVGNLQFASGDDEFLMRKLSKQFPGSILPIKFPSVVVTTQPQSSIKHFINQRLRWAGKWKGNESIRARLLALFVFVFQLTVIMALGFLFVSNYRLEVGLLLGFKCIMEGYFLFMVSKGLNQRFSISSLLILQVIYPFYVLVVGLLSQVLDYEWKGRRELS